MSILVSLFKTFTMTSVKSALETYVKELYKCTN